MYRFNVNNSMQGNDCRSSSFSGTGKDSCRFGKQSCEQYSCRIQPMACRPCCCPTYVICCCRGGASPQTFSVTYAPNGGAGGTTESNLALGTRYVVKLNGEVGVLRPGYTFTGWNTEAGGGGTEYQPGETINISENVTLYAQWDPASFDVNYEANGGTGQYNDPDVPSGSRYIIKTQAQTGVTNGGKTITSWNTEAGGTGISYAPGSETVLDRELTLFAQWSE